MYQITIKDTETGDGISYLTECFAMAIRPAGEEGTLGNSVLHGTAEELANLCLTMDTIRDGILEDGKAITQAFYAEGKMREWSGQVREKTDLTDVVPFGRKKKK